jgi:hypothetical protein
MAVKMKMGGTRTTAPLCFLELQAHGDGDEYAVFGLGEYTDRGAGYC